MLFGKLLPREGNFFELFNQHGDHIAEGARAFIRLIQHYADPELRDKHASEVGNAERAGRPDHRRGATGCCTRPSSRRSTASRSTA